MVAQTVVAEEGAVGNEADGDELGVDPGSAGSHVGSDSAFESLKAEDGATWLARSMTACAGGEVAHGEKPRSENPGGSRSGWSVFAWGKQNASRSGIGQGGTASVLSVRGL